MLNCVVFSWHFLTIYLYLSLSFSHRVAVTKVAKALARNCRRCWRRNCSCLRLPPAASGYVALVPHVAHMSHPALDPGLVHGKRASPATHLPSGQQARNSRSSDGAQLFMSRLSSDDSDFRWILQELLSICFGNLPRCVAFAEDVDLPTSVKLVGAHREKACRMARKAGTCKKIERLF
jgi:hypothetical protein